MDANEALQILNKMPYLYQYIGTGINLRFKEGEKEVCGSRCRQGGMNVTHKDSVFRFAWNGSVGQWIHWDKRRNVSK